MRHERPVLKCMEDSLNIEAIEKAARIGLALKEVWLRGEHWLKK